MRGGVGQIESDQVIGESAPYIILPEHIQPGAGIVVDKKRALPLCCVRGCGWTYTDEESRLCCASCRLEAQRHLKVVVAGACDRLSRQVGAGAERIIRKRPASISVGHSEHVVAGGNRNNALVDVRIGG